MREEGWRRIPVSWAFLLGAAAITVLFYRDFIFRPGALLWGSDMMIEGYPLRRFLVDEVQAGRGVPLWTPHVYAGMPYVALLPGPVFYPTTLLYYLLPLSRAIGWTFVLHTFLGGAFAYFMARSFRLRASSAAVCGISFLLTGYVTSHLFGGQDGRMFAMALLPLALGCLERALRSGEAGWYAGLAGAVALQILTPHTQIVYFSGLALSVHLLFHLLVRARSPAGGTGDAEPRDAGAGRRELWRPAVGFALAMVGAACLGAVQLLPTFALLEHVTRSAAETGYAFASSWALPPQELTALFLPDLIGSLESYWGGNPLKLHTEYLGSIPLALALLAVASSFRPVLPAEDRRMVWFLAGASLLGLLFALGSVTPVHRVAAALLPLMSSFRAPAMMMAAVAVFTALLAGFGWEAVLAARRREPAGASPAAPWALLLLGAPILFLAIAAAADPAALQRFARLSWFEPGWPRLAPETLRAPLRQGGLFVLAGFAIAWGAGWLVARRRVSTLALIAVLLFAVADQWRIADRYLQVRDRTSEWTADPIIERLRREAGPGERAWALEGTYGANELMYWGIPSPVGTQKFQLEPYARLVGAVRAEEGLLRHQTLIPFFRVAWLVTASPQPRLTAALESDGRRLYRIPAPPHAFFPAEVRAARDESEAIETTRSNRDPLSLAVVEGADPSEMPGAGEGSATLVRYEPELVELEVDAERGGLLAVSEIFHPGWVARVDGAEARIWKTNVAFRGVEVPAGSHRVAFEYRSRPYAVGRWLSLASALALVLLLGRGWWTRRSAAGRRADAGAID